MKRMTLMISLLAMILYTSSCAVPGSDQWKIRSAAEKYLKQDFGNGDKIVSMQILKKLSCQVNGRDCKYAEVECSIIFKGRTSKKMLYLLMSDHCDSLYEISDCRNNDLMKKSGVDNPDLDKMIKERLNQELNDRGLR